MKGIVLDSLRRRHHSRPIRKYYLRWWLKANPDTIRRALVKIPAYCHLNEQIVYWRFRKLLDRPKDPTTVPPQKKMQLLCNGLMVLSSVFQKHLKNLLFGSFTKIFFKRNNNRSIE